MNAALGFASLMSQATSQSFGVWVLGATSGPRDLRKAAQSPGLASGPRGTILEFAHARTGPTKCEPHRVKTA